MNVWAVTGRVSIAPESKTSAAGRAYTQVNIAIHIEAKPRDDTQKPKALFVRCMSFNERTSQAMSYLQVGDPVTVVGRLERQRYTDANNVERENWTLWTDQIVSSRNWEAPKVDAPPAPARAPAPPPPIDDSEMDIPF